MRRRGTILVAVLVLVTLGSLGATTLLVGADAGTTAAGLSRDRDRVRGLARSGVRAVMTELASAREALLRGGAPELTDTWTVFTDDLGRRGVVRLVDLAPDRRGTSAIPEASRLDVNAATGDMLAALPGIDEALGERIVSAGPFSSPEALVRVEGVTPELLYGAPEGEAQNRATTPEGGASSEGSGASGAPGDDAGGADGATGEDRPLIELLTVFSADPNVQMGLVERRARGDLRINLNRAWSDELESAVSRRFDRDAAEFLGGMMQSGVRFESDSDIVAQLRDLAGGEYEMWLNLLDAFTTTDDQFRPGRVDLSRAPAVVLGAVPGISEQAARELVRVRDGLSEETRRKVTWPLEEGVLAEEAFERAIGHLTTRSLQWRVRIEAGMLAGERAERSSAQVSSEARLEGAITLEAVVDVASERPRIAYLRDVSMLDASRRVAAESGSIREALAVREPERAASADGDGEVAVYSPEAGTQREAQDADRGGSDGDAGAETEDSAGFEGLEFGLGGSEGGSGDGGDEGAGFGSDGLDLGFDRPGAREASGAEDEGAPDGGGTDEAVDRRIGRWTTRGRGEGS